MGHAAESLAESFSLSNDCSISNRKTSSKKHNKIFSKLDECLNESLALLSVCEDHPKKDCTETVADLVPVTFGRLNLSKGKPTPKNIKVLLDSGSSGTIMCENLAKKLRIKKPRLPGGKPWQVLLVPLAPPR